MGLAANGVIFNVLDAMVLRPFDFPNTPRLVRVWETGPGTDGIDRENVAAGQPARLAGPGAGGSAVAEMIAIDDWETSLRTDGASEHVESRPSLPGSSRRSASPPPPGARSSARRRRKGRTAA